MTSKSGAGGMAIGLLIGLGFGAAAGILMAPRKGQETREQIRRKAMEARDKMKQKASQAADQAKETANKAAGKTQETASRAQQRSGQGDDRPK